ncbi:UNVERIFIED_CONTAM: hypothetical protein K2H54_026399 [Gekko kuhli]
MRTRSPGEPNLLELAVVPALPYPMLLGRDVYGFRCLLHKDTGLRTLLAALVGEPEVAAQDDTPDGGSDSETEEEEEGQGETPTDFSGDPQFR